VSAETGIEDKASEPSKPSTAILARFMSRLANSTDNCADRQLYRQPTQRLP